YAYAGGMTPNRKYGVSRMVGGIVGSASGSILGTVRQVTRLAGARHNEGTRGTQQRSLPPPFFPAFSGGFLYSLHRAPSPRSTSAFPPARPAAPQFWCAA